MRREAWGASALLAALVAWDLAVSGDKWPSSAELCALAVAAAVPSLARANAKGLALGLWNLAGRYSPYAAAGLLGVSHFIAKSPSGASLVPSVLYVVGLLAFVELASWARYSSGFGDYVGAGVDGAWAGAFATRFVPLATMAVGLSVASLALAAGFEGTWTALALAVVFIAVVVVMARTAAKVS